MVTHGTEPIAPHGSAVYDTVVRHHRLVPAPYELDHRLAWWLIDLDDLPQLDAHLPGFGWNRPAPVSFHDRDHLGRDDRPLRKKLALLLADHGVCDADGSIRVLANPRVLGATFDPISVWWCHRADGSLAAIVAEISNTFGETRPQVLVPGPADASAGDIGRRASGPERPAGLLTFEHRKELHVSPFVDLAATYRYRISSSPEALAVVAIEVVDAGGTTVLRTSAVGRRRAITASTAFRHAPTLTPHRVVASIHRHALGLWRRGAPFRPKPPYRSDLGSVPEGLQPADARRPITPGAAVSANRLAPPPTNGSPARALVAAGRTLALTALRALPHGRITVVLPDGARHVFGTDDGTGDVELRVLDDRFLARLVTRRRLALGEGWTAGEWSADDLPTCLTLLHDLSEHHRRSGATGRLAALQERRPHLRRPRSQVREHARTDIAHHYDLGNELYERFLDPTMAYSSAWYRDGTQTLEEAQLTKFERLCDLLELGADDHLLEIGCGWGGFAIHAAATRGCRVDAVTLSHEQAVAARRRVTEAGLDDLVRVIERDYRDLDGTYDKVASVEMIEAVGHDLDTFFTRCDELLRPGGILAVQAIAKPDQRARRVRNLDDGWIERYIFPGSLIPDLTGLTSAATHASELVLAGADEFGASYARTLAEWRRRFDAHRTELEALGYDDQFARAWDFYLSTAEAGFRVGYLRVFHLTFRRIGAPAPIPEGGPPVPSTADAREVVA